MLQLGDGSAPDQTDQSAEGLERQAGDLNHTIMLATLCIILCCIL
jgi:hypothetical protein